MSWSLTNDQELLDTNDEPVEESSETTYFDHDFTNIDAGMFEENGCYEEPSDCDAQNYFDEDTAKQEDSETSDSSFKQKLEKFREDSANSPYKTEVVQLEPGTIGLTVKKKADYSEDEQEAAPSISDSVSSESEKEREKKQN
jgi:hypothetical protein